VNVRESLRWQCIPVEWSANGSDVITVVKSLVLRNADRRSEATDGRLVAPHGRY
jgi:hypothetical protein